MGDCATRKVFPHSLSGHVDVLTLPPCLRLQTLDLQNVVSGFAKMTKADIQVALNAGIKMLRNTWSWKTEILETNISLHQKTFPILDKFTLKKIPGFSNPLSVNYLRKTRNRRPLGPLFLLQCRCKLGKL